MSEGAPRELSLAEIDDLSMQAIDQITPRDPVAFILHPVPRGHPLYEVIEVIFVSVRYRGLFGPEGVPNLAS